MLQLPLYFKLLDTLTFIRFKQTHFTLMESFDGGERKNVVIFIHKSVPRDLDIICILLSCQPSVTVTSCFVYNFIRDLESIDHLCINPICRIGLIHE